MRCIDCGLFDICNDTRRIDHKAGAINYICTNFRPGTNGSIFMMNGKYIDTVVVDEKMREIDRIMGPDKREDIVRFRKIKLVIGDMIRYIFVAEIK